jgi:translation initiation factor 2 subunit 1
MQKRKKTDDIKREQKSEKIVELIAKTLKKDTKEFYDNISSKIFEKYEYISECFDDIVSESVNLEKLGIDANTAKVLAEVVKDKIKPVEVQIKGKLDLVSYAPDGAEIIKDALKKAEAIDKNVIIKYVGAGKYSVTVTASDYKEAEKLLEKSTKKALTLVEKAGGKGSFEREEK